MKKGKLIASKAAPYKKSK